jgi:hypothetical protein
VLLLSKEKQEEAEARCGDRGAQLAPEPSARLTNRATSLQPHFNHCDTSKTTLTITTKREKRTTIKEVIKT